ncbi:MAG: HAD family phosphatase [Acidobacteriia bacterium]|nr:HAD family phosphatase [Terriglobia bacterium]
MDRANSSKIKAVILDYGEVLCYSPTAEEWARMAGVFGIEPPSFRELWNRNRLLYDRGDLSPEAYWSAVAKDAGTQLAPEQLPLLRQWDVEMWAHENSVMVEWLKEIHSSGTRTGLLSNMPHDMIRHVRQQFAWLEHFDHQTFSAEVELIKPDGAIYEHSLRGVGVAASEALFVDDKEPNIQGARAVGMRAIQLRSMEQFGSDLEELGFPIMPS